MENLNPSLTIRQALEDFYSQNKYGKDGGADKKLAWIKFGFFSLPMPNLESRSTHLYFHDVNHIASGNNTSWQGESSVSAWEIASGGWKDTYFVWFLALWAMGLGVVFYPGSVIKSFKCGLTMNNALTSGLSKSEMMNLSIYDLRKLLSNQPNRKNTIYFWMPFSFLVFVLPFVTGAIFIGAVLRLL